MSSLKKGSWYTITVPTKILELEPAVSCPLQILNRCSKESEAFLMFYDLDMSVSVCEGRGFHTAFVDIWTANPTSKLKDLFARGAEGIVRGLLQLCRKPQNLSSTNSSSSTFKEDIIFQTKATSGTSVHPSIHSLNLFYPVHDCRAWSLSQLLELNMSKYI